MTILSRGSTLAAGVWRAVGNLAPAGTRCDGRRMFAAFLLLSSLALPAGACDLCGCFMGLTPYDNQSSITVLHRFRSYHGYVGQPHNLVPAGAALLRAAPGQPMQPAPGAGGVLYHAGHAHGPQPSDFEAYQVDELRLKYFVARRLEVSAFLPWVRNTIRYGDETTHLRGMGDLTLLAGWHVLRRVEVEGNWQHRLIAGLGVKLPVGRTGMRDPVSGARYATLVQPGTGTTDGFGWLTYVGRWRRVGLSLNSSVKLTGENRYHESVAPAFTQYGSLFYLIPLGADWRVLPAVQAFYERTQGETYYGELTGEHAANTALLGPGLDVFWRNLQLTTSVQWSVYDRAPVDHPRSAGRVVMGLTYNLPQTHYLVGK